MTEQIAKDREPCHHCGVFLHPDDLLPHSRRDISLPRTEWLYGYCAACWDAVVDAQPALRHLSADAGRCRQCGQLPTDKAGLGSGGLCVACDTRRPINVGFTHTLLELRVSHATPYDYREDR